MSDSSHDSELLDQFALQTRLLRAIQTDMGSIRVQYTQTKSCESYERQQLVNAIQALSDSCAILSELVTEYRDITSIRKRKYFAVAQGDEPGVYTDYYTARNQIKCIADAKFGAFDSFAEAKRWVEGEKARLAIESGRLDVYEEEKNTKEIVERVKRCLI